MTMHVLNIERKVSTRIPTPVAEFSLYYYSNNRDNKEHVAFVTGDVADGQDVLVRVHSECFTGDVLGSMRCDCGSQLNLSVQRIASEGRGVVLYLRQEGRGIGLLEKLKAYNLQDVGYDTVDANIALGHQADQRDYEVAALILRDIGVRSVRLLTNNPSKIDGLREFGIDVTSREPLQPRITVENKDYIETKASKLGHLLDLSGLPGQVEAETNGATPTPLKSIKKNRNSGIPSVTLSYAQSLDGCIAMRPGRPIRLSGAESEAMTHSVRGVHDAILVGIGTVLADDPGLTVRLAKGAQPQPVILDSKLRFPLTAQLLGGTDLTPWIATTDQASVEKKRALEDAGARVISLPSNSRGWVELPALLALLGEEGMGSVMVEGGSRVITSFLTERLVDHVVLTVAPIVLGGMRAVKSMKGAYAEFPTLANTGYKQVGKDMVIWGDPVWDGPSEE